MIEPYTKAMQTGRSPKEIEHKADKGSEKVLQQNCEELLQYYPDIAVIRIPDAAYKAIFAAHGLAGWIKPMISRYLKGLPDFVLLRRSGGVTRALCIELKSARGKQSQGQKHFAGKVDVHICRSVEHFQELLDSFMGE